MTDLAKAARAASRAIAKMNGNGKREGSDQRGMAWGDVVAVHNQFVDVMTGGTVSGSLRYTTACDGIAEGDRVLIQHVGREPVVVGIVSKGEKVLFESDDAVLEGPIKMSESVKKFRYLDVFGLTNDGYQIFTRVLNPSKGTQFFMIGGQYNGTAFFKGKVYTFTDETTMETFKILTRDLYVTYQWDNASGAKNGDYIGIVKVVGAR